jgi:hypothetical protein
MTPFELPRTDRITEDPALVTCRAWSDRAQVLIQQALSQVIDNADAIGTLEHAIACLRAEEGGLDADDFGDLAALHAEPKCIWPPELLERGGHRGGCSVHGLC